MTRAGFPRQRIAAWLIAWALLIVAPPRAAAQPTPWLPVDHWSRVLLERLHAQGAAKHDAAARARRVGDAAAALPPPFLAWLSAETAAGTGRMVQVQAGAELVTRRDALVPGGFTRDREWIAPQRQPELVTAGARILASASGRRVAATLDAVARGDRMGVDHATIEVSLGHTAVWIGRAALGFAPAAGGLVLHEIARFDGLGVRLQDPVTLPLIGALRGELFAGPLAPNGHVQNPWLAAMRLHARPHPRLDVGATRAAVFGAMGDARLGVGEILHVIAGTNLGGHHADDQVASIDARWRPLLGALPIELHGEWAMHDIDPGVFIDVPAFSVGVRLPRLGGDGRVGVSIEHHQVSGACCRNPPWYHHFELADGWATRGAPLGHPLGGHGREWRMTATFASLDPLLVLSAAGAVRTRNAENLFAPTRLGRALAVDLAGDARLMRHAAARLRLFVERGRDWHELRTALRLTIWR